MDSQATPGPVICEVCGTYFETRRGLSSHARLHLRQLGVTLSESSGAPIELLYQLIQDKDGSPSDLKPESSVLESTPLKKSSQQESSTPSMQEDINTSYKTEVKDLTSPQKMDHQGSPAKLKEPTTSLLPSSPSARRHAEGCSSSFSEHQTVTKPLWAPLETDAPISLASDTKDEIHVCQLCGSWYETRKGLSAHARAHLRQIGIPDSEIKGSPIDFLYQMMEEEDLKPISVEQQEEHALQSSPTSSNKRPVDLNSPPESSPSKRPKTSADCTCVLCGEVFENRKGLASHARSHLRHFGVSELVGKSSAIDAIQELVSSGMIEPVHAQTKSSTTSSSAEPSPAPPSTAVPALSPGPSQSCTSLLSRSLSSSPLKKPLSPQALVNRAPKAKKGFRLAVDPLYRKPKPEPIETDVSDQPKPPSTDGNSQQKSPTAAVSAKPSDSELQSPPTVLCDFCGQLFETRKALSCHVRAHLRQLGLTWSIRTSPIDLLKEVMLHGDDRIELIRSSSSASGKGTSTPQSSKRPRDSLPSGEGASNSCTSPVDYSMKEKSSSVKSGASHADTSCELCGFDFENRKALASHARAHLRQLGLFEWKAEGATSPIELLSELIRKDPAMVSEITRRYRFGDLYIKKSQKNVASPLMYTDSVVVPSSSLKSTLQQHEHRASRKDHSSIHARSQRGVYAPKHGVSSVEENQGANSQQPPRSGIIPALLPKPPLTPLVKLVGKIYSLKCRFCEEVFHGPLSVQEQWITHLQKHILSLGYKGKAAPPAAPVTSPALIHPVAV
ncbi:protein Wiz-like [Melanotaenia boesemani]|uniref:protein Wiz-like n=1 Tax=Melanotaenia boesemani TaxID=1250792 RepID=UPI001C04BD66|nr:protein Wiz-like [Melanotaenia boesemani]